MSRWYCPNCRRVTVRFDWRPNMFHNCPKLGIMAPMVPEGVKAKVEAKPREDYVGNERGLRYIGSTAIMSVVTTRDDGQDVDVFAPPAHADLRS